VQSKLIMGVRHYLARVKSLETDARIFLGSEMGYMYGRTVFRTIFNLYLLSLGYSMAFVGTFNALRILAQCAAAIPAGMVGRRIGLRNALITGDLLTACASGLQALAPTGGLILVGACAEGVGTAQRTVNRPAFIAGKSTPEQRNHFFSLRMVLSNAIGMLGSGSGGFLPIMIAVHLGFAPGDPAAYRAVLLLSLLVMAGGALVLFKAGEVRDAGKAPDGRKVGFLDVFREKALHPLLSAESLVAFGGGLYVPILNAYLSEYLGATSGDVGVIFSLRRIVAAGAVLLAPVLAAHMGQVRSMLTLKMGCAPVAAALGLTTNLTLAAVLIPVRRSLISTSTAIRTAFSMEAFSQENRVSGYSVMRTGKSLAQGIATAMGAWLMEAVHPSVPFLLAAAAYTAGALVISAKLSCRRRRSAGRACSR